MSGCPQCGSEQGSALQLCPDCVAKGQAAQAAKRDALRAVEPEDPVDILIHSPWTQSAGAVTLFTLLFVFFLFAGPLGEFGETANGLFALMVGSGAIATLTGISFWLRMLMFDPMWAIVSVIFPFLIYRYCFLRWEEAAVKIYTLLHFLALIITFGAAWLVADITSKSIYEVLNLYEMYTFTYPQPPTVQIF